MKRQESFCTLRGNVSWYSPYGNSIEVHQKLKIELPYDLAISLWNIYLKETKTLTWKPSVHCSNICSVARLCLTLCNPMDCSMPGSSVLHYLPKFAQIHVHWIGDAIYLILCGPLLLLPSVFLSIGIFQWVSSSHQVAEVLELQLQHQSFQLILRVDFL